MSTHTQGRLKARAWNSHAETTIVRDTSGPVEGIAECGGFGRASADCEIDARRLVACWNACDGMPTSLLEHTTFDNADAAVSHEILVELIEELRKLVAHHRELIAAGFGDDTAIQPAVATLAKHKVCA